MSAEADQAEKLVIAKKEEEAATAIFEDFKKEEKIVIEEEKAAVIREAETEAQAVAQEQTATDLYAAADLDTADLEKLRLADEAQALAD